MVNWTEKRVERLKLLPKEGLSASVEKAWTRLHDRDGRRQNPPSRTEDKAGQRRPPEILAGKRSPHPPLAPAPTNSVGCRYLARRTRSIGASAQRPARACPLAIAARRSRPRAGTWRTL